MRQPRREVGARGLWCPRVSGPLVMVFSALLAVGCNSKALSKSAPAASASATPGGLSPELASKVLAKVGNHDITLGEYAATLERMDGFERLRYQSPERRQELLQEMINVDLLAAEARRRGLDKLPETKERIRQILRDELMSQLRAKEPKPSDLSESVVRDYYEKHKSDFLEPERRRVADIAMKDQAQAQKVLALAEKATPMEWGRLVQRYSIDKPPKPSPTHPLELSGDLGIVSAPGTQNDDNPRVPDALRDAVFKIDKLGGVYPQLVQVGSVFHIVRMVGKTAGRQRTASEAERTIRVRIVQEDLKKKRDALDKELRQRFPVKLDDAALAKVAVPALQAPPAGSAAPSSP
jgi:peptidyl-prolyl cis-trans isomerase C